ncbi:hypothetical protein L207DRAFT_519656, partial [Hyaloscypha variabilis F]
MPTHHYSHIPDEDSLNRLNRSYYTGLPSLSTAPPSFHSVALSNTDLPHRNDETAATVIPLSAFPRAEDNATNPAISLYAPSESAIDLEAATENTIASLTNQVELLQQRVEDQSVTIKEGLKNIEKSFKKVQEDVKRHGARGFMGHKVAGKLRAGLVGLWVLCIIGVVMYFVRPASPH